MKTQERPITSWDYIFSEDERGYDLILLKTTTQDGKHAHGNKPYIQQLDRIIGDAIQIRIAWLWLLCVEIMVGTIHDDITTVQKFTP
jgi:hypothetical protein